MALGFYSEMGYVFLAVLLLIFALTLFAAGVFTAYFGSGRSRAIGAGLTGGGVVIGLVVVLLFYFDILFPEEVWLWESVVLPAIIYLAAALVGALAAVGLFIFAIMKA